MSKLTGHAKSCCIWHERLRLRYHSRSVQLDRDLQSRTLDQRHCLDQNFLDEPYLGPGRFECKAKKVSSTKSLRQGRCRFGLRRGRGGTFVRKVALPRPFEGF